MNVDFFTFFAQILNFLVLLFILNKLVYKPVIKAMNERNNKIKNAIDNAENKLREAEEMKDKYNEELRSIEVYKEEQKVKIDADLTVYKSDEMQKLKGDLEKQREIFNKQLENEKEAIIEDMIRRFCFGVNGFLKDVFSSISNLPLNSAVLENFLAEVKNISDEELDKINKAEEKNLEFISSYDLTNEEKTKVENILKTKGILFEKIDFITDKSILLGNKIAIDGIIINSNIKNIIDNFTIKLESIL